MPHVVIDPEYVPSPSVYKFMRTMSPQEAGSLLEVNCLPALLIILSFSFMASTNSAQVSQPNYLQEPGDENFNYSERSQWLRAAVLGANDGLVSTASLMMGIGAVKNDVKAMVLTGYAGLVAGACSMAIGEFVSVYSQREIEVAQIKRENRMNTGGTVEETNYENLPNPFKAAVASALAFTLGAMVPLLAASFIEDHKVRLAAVTVAASIALVVFGGSGAMLGGAPVIRSCARVLVGGWMAMGITFGLAKGVGSGGLDM